jgi:hypothetical protein
MRGVAREHSQAPLSPADHRSAKVIRDTAEK